jgi:hypothetical protein
VNAHERLEARLKVLDLRLEHAGAHLDEERVALIAGGDEPLPSEAQHLAGCDECVDLLVTLGGGLERLVAEGAGASTLLAPPAPTPRRKRGRPALVVALVLVAGAAAAAGGLWLAGPGAPPEPSRAPVEPPPVRSALPAAGAAGKSPEAPLEAPPPAGEPEAPPASAPGAPPAAEPEKPTAAAEPPAVGAAKPAVAESPSAAGPARPAVAASAHPPAGEELDTSLRGRAPTKLDRRFVEGPPPGHGYLRLNSQPPARVFIDGKPLEWTPLVDVRLPEGVHDVELRYEHPQAREPVRRFRVLITPDKTYRDIVDNVRR